MKGSLSALAAFLVWGLASSVLLRSIPLPGPIVTDFGLLVGTLALGAFMGRRRWPEIRSALGQYKLRLFLLALAFAGTSMTFHWAVKATTVANAVLIHSLQPILTALVFAPLVLKQRPDRRTFLALGLGLVGMAVLLWPQLRWDLPAGSQAAGIALAAASAAFFAAFNVQFPWFEGRLSRDVVLLFCLGIGFCLVLPFAASVDAPPTGGAVVLKAAAFGLANFVFANFLFFYALANAPVVRVGTLAYLEPVVAIGAAALWLGEPFTAHAVLGGLLILASGALAVFGDKKTADG